MSPHHMIIRDSHVTLFRDGDTDEITRASVWSRIELMSKLALSTSPQVSIMHLVYAICFDNTPGVHY